MFKKIFIAFLSIILVITLSGCNVGKQLNYEIGYIGEPSIFDTTIEAKIIKSYEDWINVNCNKNDLNLKYNEEFFINNVVVIYSYETNVMGNKFEVKSFFKEGKKLIVNIKVIKGYMDALSSGSIILELSKFDCSEIKNVKINK